MGEAHATMLLKRERPYCKNWQGRVQQIKYRQNLRSYTASQTSGITKQATAQEG